MPNSPLGSPASRYPNRQDANRFVGAHYRLGRLEGHRHMIEQTAFINRLYSLFNARDIDGVFDLLAPDVVWANGINGGHVHGHDEIRAYWTRQWSMIDPRVDPVDIAVLPSGIIVVHARQVVRDKAGKTLSDEIVEHRFTLQAGKVARFDIGERQHA